ncbi:DUF5819 family protein [Humidisolicoccus flavus]|uniref:DUF5819 family protein n=1 Tax=Humidisolicoccus flavus TaxID=3111414 RepID=UPI00324AC1CE
MTTSTNLQRTRRPIIVRAVALVAVLAVVWHVFASFLWIFPPSPLRQLVPGNALSSYMLPMFGQSWTVFAPEPINGDYHFNVRAVVENDGEQEVTGWVSATDVELSMIQNNLFPPRAGAQAEELASTYRNLWLDFSEEQTNLIGADYTDTDWLAALEADLAATATEADIDTYVAQEQQMAAYATQVAKAIWGDDVVQIQYRVSRQNVIPFADRNDPSAVRPDPHVVLPGWRPTIVVPGQNEDNFADVFLQQYRSLQGLQ